jgi:hypothetical protein
VTVARLFIKMLLLSAAPQDLPYSYRLMGRVTCLYFLSGVLIQSNLVELVVAIKMMLLNTAILLSFSYAVLTVWKFKMRFIQTVAALLGTGVLFNMLIWPITGLMSMGGSSDIIDVILALLMLSMLSWELLITAHIYKNALNLSMAPSIMLSFALFFISISFSKLFFPEFT